MPVITIRCWSGKSLAAAEIIREADVVDYPLKFSGGPLDDRSWQALVRQWFRSGEQILVVDGPPFVAPERGSATLASSDNHFNSLSISVEAEAPTSVLIRMGHSRKWRAWTQDGQLPVHRVTPNNMLVVVLWDACFLG